MKQARQTKENIIRYFPGISFFIGAEITETFYAYVLTDNTGKVFSKQEKIIRKPYQKINGAIGASALCI